VIEVRPDILIEKDGPMLVHGLQGFQNSPLLVPRAASHQPCKEFLAERYEIFKRAG
jgi:putative restriction endonuclease